MNFANSSYGAATEFYWDFGNGNTSTETLPAPQTYTTDSITSIYTATLIASNTCGADTVAQNVVVDPADVRAFFSASPTEGCVPLDVNFYNYACLLYTSPSPRDGLLSRMPSSA